jgi:hypothetical protein
MSKFRVSALIGKMTSLLVLGWRLLTARPEDVIEHLLPRLGIALFYCRAMVRSHLRVVAEMLEAAGLEVNEINLNRFLGIESLGWLLSLLADAPADDLRTYLKRIDPLNRGVLGSHNWRRTGLKYCAADGQDAVERFLALLVFSEPHYREQMRRHLLVVAEMLEAAGLEVNEINLNRFLAIEDLRWLIGLVPVDRAERLRYYLSEMDVGTRILVGSHDWAVRSLRTAGCTAPLQ